MFVKEIRTRVAILAFFCLCAMAVAANAGDGQHLYCTDVTDSSVVFYISSSSGDLDSTVAVQAMIYSEISVQGIHMDIVWDSTELIFGSLDFDPWEENHPGVGQTDYILENAGRVKLQITNVGGLTFTPDPEPIANLWLKLDCFASGTASAISYKGRCTEGVHISDPEDFEYGPQIVAGGVTMNAISHTLDPQDAYSTINDTFEVPVTISCPWIADNGFGSCWEFTKDSLTFVDVKGGPLIMYNNPSYDSSVPGKLYIYYGGAVYTTSTPDTAFYIRFQNVMHRNYTEASVSRISDTLKICTGSNSALYSIITDTSTATPTTYYEATIKFKQSSGYKNTNNVQFPVELSNNFWVQIKDYPNASWFKIDNTQWTLITWSGHDKANPDWAWVLAPGSDDFQFKNDPDESESNIDPTPSPASFHNVSIQKVNTGSEVGWQVANILPDTTKLKDVNAEITIYSNGWVYADSGIALVPDSFQVKSSPPGGCPFVYAWNGAEFEEDNTILAASEIYPGEPVTDYYLLSKPLVSTGDRYRLQIREFENEVSYIDQMKLVAVEHSAETKVAVTPSGEIFAYNKQLAPAACVDHNGVDQLSKVGHKDGVYFISEQPGHLILTYNRRSIGPNVLYDPPPVGTDAGGPGPPPGQKRADKVSNLTVEIEDMYGEWHKLGNVPPRFHPERSFCILQTGDLELADRFQVKLSWDQYYSADELKYYIQSREQPISVWRSPVSAVSSHTGEVCQQLLKDDGEYATVTPGQTLEVSFRAASYSEPGMVRDFVLQTIGYYTSLKKPSVAPTSFVLLNNYPNPFNASTIINYALPQASDVKLEIFNVLGQRIRILVNEHQTAGYKRQAWDGKDDKGQDVSSGIYFYRLQTQDFSDSRKMVLMR